MAPGCGHGVSGGRGVWVCTWVQRALVNGKAQGSNGNSDHRCVWTINVSLAHCSNRLHNFDIHLHMKNPVCTCNSMVYTPTYG